MARRGVREAEKQFVRHACSCLQFAAWPLSIRLLHVQSKTGSRAAALLATRLLLFTVAVILKSPVYRQVPRFPRILQIGRRNCKSQPAQQVLVVPGTCTYM